MSGVTILTAIASCMGLDKYGFKLELKSCVENSEYEVTSISTTDRCCDLML